MSAAWSREIATGWKDGILAGTGVVGAVVYGSPTSHRLIFSHELFFVPVNSRKEAPDLAKTIPAVRAALADRDETAAADLIDDALRSQGWDIDELIWTDPLGPIAELEWAPAGQHSWSEYRRTPSLSDGSCEVDWSNPDAGRAGFRVHARHGENRMDLEIWSSVPLIGTLRFRPVRESGSNAATVLPVDYSDDVHTTTTSDLVSTIVTAEAVGTHPGAGVRASARLDVREGRPVANGSWDVEVYPGRPLRLSIELEVAGAAAPQLPHTLAKPESSHSLVSSLRLGQDSVSSVKSTEALWRSALRADTDAESEIVQLAYRAGIRNVLASTGSLPPTLQGVWQGTWSPAWSADYTLNGNVQLGGLAAASWTGNPALMKSLFRLIVPFAEHYRSNARRIYGLPGMVLPSRMTTHGHMNHFLRSYPHAFWIGSGPWFLRMAADYIQVTGEADILEDWLWDFTTEILTFSEAYLQACDGELSPSYSPENTPAGRENPLATDAASDIAALRDGFAIGAWLARVRGDRAREDRWRETRERVPSYTVAQDGTLSEWGTGWPQQIAHRHASQLQGLWYKPDELLTEEPFREAALRTIREKIAWRAAEPWGPPGRMEMAFGLSSIGIAAATLGDAESAYQCALWLARDHFTPALTTTHDSGAIFNLDAAGALPATVAIMLVQSSLSCLRLLPALPGKWGSGEVRGLTARGGIRVDRLTWDVDGAHVGLSLPASSRWLRPEGTRILLPRHATLLSHPSVRQTDERTLHIAPAVEGAEFALRWATETR